MIDEKNARLIRRLTAAEGYLELDMPDYALEELQQIGNAGPYSGVVDWLTGEALREKEQFGAAIESLQRAVRDIPVPHNRAAVAALSHCLRSTGRDDLAEVIEQYSSDFPHSESADHPALHPPSDNPMDTSNRMITGDSNGSNDWDHFENN